MAIHGEFRLKNGIVLRNQFTIFGMQSVLKAAFWSELTLWEMGLCAHNPGDNVALSTVREPTLGENGYTRQTVPLTQHNWPGIGVINGESYIESRLVTFAISDSVDESVNRLFLTDGDQVIAISSPLEGGLQLLDSPLSTSYRLFFH